MPEQEEQESLIHVQWVHSHEESLGDRLVFRPADFAFPPSRGRSALIMEPDGTVLFDYPGPTDRRSRSAGHWRFEDNYLVIEGPVWPGIYGVEDVDARILVLKRR